MAKELIKEGAFSLSDNCEMFKLDDEILRNIAAFSCGDADLDDFFNNEALAYEKELMGKTYCWLMRENSTQCVGMVTLANAGIQTTHLQNNPRRKINCHIPFTKRGRTYPAVLIGRIGVNVNYQGSQYRIGKQIMDFIKTWFDGTDNKTGCRFLLVDAVNTEHAVKYYERNGFKPLFPREESEKEFYGIPEDESLRTRMYYFDLL